MMKWIFKYIMSLGLGILYLGCTNPVDNVSLISSKDSIITDSLFLIKGIDTLRPQERPINAELIGWDSTINLALSATFTRDELIDIYKHKKGTMNVLCCFDKSGKVTNAFIDYCKCSDIVQGKFGILLNNIKKYVCFKVADYYRCRQDKGESFYTGFLIVNLRLFSVDEIAVVNDRFHKEMEIYNDTTRVCP